MKLTRIVYCGLVGTVWGLALALLLAQWVWLEMRFNTGYFILGGFALGIIAKLSRFNIMCRHRLGLASLGVLAVVALAVTGGEPGALLVVPAVIFREGIHLPMLPLGIINTLLAVILTLILALSVQGIIRKRGI